MGAAEINLTSKPNDHILPPIILPTYQPSDEICAITMPPTSTINTNHFAFRRTIKYKPKSRFGEPSLPIDSGTLETFGFGYPRRSEFEFTSASTRSHLNSLMPKTPVGGSKGDSTEGPDEREVYRRVTAQLAARKNTNSMTRKFLFQFLFFLIILSCLVASFTSKKMEGAVFCGIKVWKWSVLLMVIFSGMLITKWVLHLLVFLIEWKFILYKNVVYFTHGLRTTAEVFIWLSVVLGTWVLLFKPDVDQSAKNREILDLVTWTIASMLIATFLWLIKNALLKLLASSFHLNRFFDRIQDSVFHHYVLQILSGRPCMACAERITKDEIISDAAACVTITEHVGSHKEKKVIDIGKLHKMKRDKVPCYTMQLLVDVVSNSGLSIMSGMLEEDVIEGGVELDDDEITSEEQAIATAVRIFENIVQYKNEREYIHKNDFLKFMREEEVDLLYPLFPTNEKDQISLKAFSKWVVKVLKDRQLLQHALNDNKTAVKQLNKIVIAVLILIVFIVWLLLTQIATTQLLLFLSSQLVVAAFIFGNTCKTIFEAIIFVFVMHPFDVGDRCLVDGEMLLVEEMNILTTVFLKDDKEKVYYPNSVLATLPISNYYRSPDNQGDTLELSIDFMTSVEKIEELKERIRKYLLENHQLWHPEHSLVVKEIEDVNKIKLCLNVNHTKNFQDFEEITRRRSDLVLEVKKILEELDIKYRQLPQQVIILNSASLVTDVTTLYQSVP